MSSYVYSIYIYIYHYSLLYFSTFSRVWEFLFGVLLVNINKSVKYDKTLVIILMFLFFLGGLVYYVPLCSIIPLSIVSLFLVSCDSNSSILSSNILTELGNISYPFYIFHYIILFKYINEMNGNVFIILVTTIVLSIVLNRIIKVNYMDKVIYIINIITIYISSVILIYIITNIMVRRNIEIQNKNAKIKYSYIQIMNEWNKFFRNVCKCQYFFSLKYEYIRESVVLFLMDSHGEQWSSIFIPFLRKLNYILIQIYYIDKQICNRKYRNLDRFFSKYNYFSYIIISHFVKCIINNSYVFTEYLTHLLNYTSKIIIIQDTPRFNLNPVDCIYSNTNKTYCYGIIGTNTSIYSFPVVLNNRIKYIDMNKYICEKNNKCNFIINGIPVYKDNTHLTLQFAKSLENEFLKYFRLKKNKRLINTTCKHEYRCYLDSVPSIK